jgi:hypothetical protein
MRTFDAAMREVLKQPKYDVLTGRAVDYREVILDALGRFVVGLLDRLNWLDADAADYNLSFFAYAFIGVAVALTLLTVAAVVYFTLRHKRKRRRQTETVAEWFGDIAEKRLSLDALLEHARVYAEQGEYREAVRHRYIALLIVLHERQWIRVDKSKTNAQLSIEMWGTRPGQSDMFDEVIDVFHRTWFGHKWMDDARYQRFVKRAEETESEE